MSTIDNQNIENLLPDDKLNKYDAMAITRYRGQLNVKSIVQQYELQNLTYSEIAKLNGCSVSSVTRLLHKIRHRGKRGANSRSVRTANGHEIDISLTKQILTRCLEGIDEGKINEAGVFELIKSAKTAKELLNSLENKGDETALIRVNILNQYGAMNQLEPVIEQD